VAIQFWGEMKHCPWRRRGAKPRVNHREKLRKVNETRPIQRASEDQGDEGSINIKQAAAISWKGPRETAM